MLRFFRGLSKQTEMEKRYIKEIHDLEMELNQYRQKYYNIKKWVEEINDGLHSYEEGGN